MICPANDPRCASPQCRGRAWTAKGRDKPNLEAFTADVAAHMRAAGSKDAGKAAAAVFAAAQREGCMFE